jgi:nitroimidazol reductase NimA-like FMN-containing flavoprotein (pyridoxamine 5'-phosphate oxidase superfamily)
MNLNIFQAQGMQQYHVQNRPDRALKSDSEIKEILKNGKFVVISMCRDNEPYIVTLSYGYDEINNSLYFHCSTFGLKLEFLNNNSKVCATVIEDGGYATNECAHNYRTVVFWGNMSIVTDQKERTHGMSVLINHLEYDPAVISNMLSKSEASYSRMEVLKLDIIEIHGKAGR